jgi:hypothetical protein
MGKMPRLILRMMTTKNGVERRGDKTVHVGRIYLAKEAFRIWMTPHGIPLAEAEPRSDASMPSFGRQNKERLLSSFGTYYV